jgi:hypothetical protein
MTGEIHHPEIILGWHPITVFLLQITGNRLHECQGRHQHAGPHHCRL